MLWLLRQRQAVKQFFLQGSHSLAGINYVIEPKPSRVIALMQKVRNDRAPINTNENSVVLVPHIPLIHLLKISLLLIG